MIRLWILAAATVVLSWGNSASAAMVITSVFRNTSAGSNSTFNTTTGVFNQSIFSPSLIVTSSQNTTITTTSLSGNGNVVRFLPVVEFGFSGFFVDFSLSQPHSFTLTSNLSSTGFGLASLGLTAITGSITPGGSPLLAPSGVYSTSGTLGSGSYSFSVAADMVVPVPSTGSANYNFDFAVAPITIPEPSSLAIVAMGMLGLPVFRRKRR